MTDCLTPLASENPSQSKLPSRWKRGSTRSWNVYLLKLRGRMKATAALNVQALAMKSMARAARCPNGGLPMVRMGPFRVVRLPLQEVRSRDVRVTRLKVDPDPTFLRQQPQERSFAGAGLHEQRELLEG